MSIRDDLAELDPEALFMDGFEWHPWHLVLVAESAKIVTYDAGTSRRVLAMRKGAPTR